LPGKPAASGVHEKGSPATAGCGKDRPSTNEVGIQGLKGHTSNRHNPLLTALTVQANGGRFCVHIINSQADDF
jgi:hypothetical protein